MEADRGWGRRVSGSANPSRFVEKKGELKRIQIAIVDLDGRERAAEIAR